MLLTDWIRLSRPRDWFQSKLPFITACGLLLAPPAVQPLTIVQMMGSVVLLAAFGYGVNDISDQSTDRPAGKPNRAVPISPVGQALFLVLTASGAFALCLLWAGNAAGPAFLLMGLATALAYSVRPTRLKERGIWGLAAAAAAQWSLPILAVSAVGSPRCLRPVAWSLAALGFAIGLRWIAVHQLADALADRRVGVRTYVSSGERAWPVILGSFASEIGLLAVTLLVGWPMSRPALIALVIWGSGRMLMRPSASFRSRLQRYGEAPLADYYFLLLPVALALSRVSTSYGFLGIAALLLLTGAPHVQRVFRESLAGAKLATSRAPSSPR
ncbi:MAG TPA: UbiA family prenyltransferase [Candidatus Binatia bacterium]|nr:UbiA family prenyltransferase [Candidatus Binatia bacterium]